MSLPTPVPISESTAHYYHGWARRVRDILNRGTNISRLSPVGLAIEAKELDKGQWQPIMLPNTGTQFASQEDRQLVYEMVTGMREIPEPIMQEAQT